LTDILPCRLSVGKTIESCGIADEDFVLHRLVRERFMHGLGVRQPLQVLKEAALTKPRRHFASAEYSHAFRAMPIA
jgi:hypothetical protein